MAKKDKRNHVEEAQANAVPPVDNSQQPALPVGEYLLRKFITMSV